MPEEVDRPDGVDRSEVDMPEIDGPEVDAPEIDGPEIDAERIERVELSDKAVALLAELTEIHGPLMFHQSGGCCDGSSPMCYPDGEFRIGAVDVLLAELDAGLPQSVPFWMSESQFAYWSHTHLTVDVVPPRERLQRGIPDRATLPDPLEAFHRRRVRAAGRRDTRRLN
jgi:hypothetical protein